MNNNTAIAASAAMVLAVSAVTGAVYLAVQSNTVCGTPGNIVEVYVRSLRKKIDPDIIETVRGAGYRFRSEP